MIEGLTKDEAEFWEEKYILDYKTMDPDYGYNLRPGGSASPLSLATKQKISEGRLGAKHHAALEVLCVETGAVFGSTQEAERITGIDNGQISKCCRGIYITAGGFHWVYGDPQIRNKYALETTGRQNRVFRRVKCLETGKEYKTIAEAEREYGFTHGYIGRNCRNEIPDVNSTHWVYIDF